MEDQPPRIGCGSRRCLRPVDGKTGHIEPWQWRLRELNGVGLGGADGRGEEACGGALGRKLGPRGVKLAGQLIGERIVESGRLLEHTQAAPFDPLSCHRFH